MAQFFFHLHNGTDLVMDPEGSDLPSLDAALSEAIESAIELWAQLIRTGVTRGRTHSESEMKPAPI